MAREFEGDRAFLKAAVADLESYLLSPQLYWALSLRGRGADGGIDQLTVGNLLLVMKRLQALPPDEQGDLDTLAARVQEIHERWPANWSRKAGQEFSARLKLWQNYLNDLFKDTGGFASGYPNAARWRAVLHLIKGAVENQDPSENDLVVLLDRRLRVVSIPGPFIWEPEVESSFPVEPYWFLHIAFRQE